MLRHRCTTPKRSPAAAKHCAQVPNRRRQAPRPRLQSGGEATTALKDSIPQYPVSGAQIRSSSGWFELQPPGPLSPAVRRSSAPPAARRPTAADPGVVVQIEVQQPLTRSSSTRHSTAAHRAQGLGIAIAARAPSDRWTVGR
ncbi:hypothetical protein EJB05_26736, partial [Eragrostis curvula]